jgi:hypothetical protein
MWRHDTATRPREHWGSSPADWEQRAAEKQREMQCAVAELKAAGYGDASVGEAIRDVLETIEVCSVNIELLTGSESFDDPAWVERRAGEALARLEAETDPVMLMGRRKIVRKWREEVARSQMVERAKALIARGDEDGAVAAFNEFRAWMKRPDRKSFDLTG